MNGILGALLICCSLSVAGEIRYNAVTDRTPRPLPPLPKLGRAGSVIRDPNYGNRILRVSDENTVSQNPGAVCTTPAAALQNTWNVTSTYFTVICNSDVWAFQFDPQRFTARPARDHTLRLKASPAFSFNDPDLIYGIGTEPDDRKIMEYNFRTRKYRTVLDCSKLVKKWEGGPGALTVSANDRIATIFGGMQDTFHYVLVYDMRTRTSTLLDTHTATVDGKPTGFHMGWGIHLVNIDKSGRYVIISKGDGSKAPNLVVWDTETNKFATVSAMPGGHYSAGYGYMVNGNGWYPHWAQWLLRSLEPDKLGTFAKLIVPDIGDDYGGREEHSSWANAKPDDWAPVFVAVTRHSDAKNPLEPWDDELIAIGTNKDHPVVYRFANHRCRFDGYFWDTPRAIVSQDGRFVVFTSNWEKTLGMSPDHLSREDVFVLELPPMENK
jgi:hypothetical protein